MNKRLGSEAWVEAGLKALADDGVIGVRIATIAERLGVTKGSFYWHFRNHREYLEAILEAWQRSGTSDVIAAIEDLGGDAATRLRNLFRMSLASDGRATQAVQAWAKSDPLAAKAFGEIMRRRIDYVERLFRELGFSRQEAAARARFAFLTLVGHNSLGAKSALGRINRTESEIIFAMLVRPTDHAGAATGAAGPSPNSANRRTSAHKTTLHRPRRQHRSSTD